MYVRASTRASRNVSWEIERFNIKWLRYTSLIYDTFREKYFNSQCCDLN